MTADAARRRAETQEVDALGAAIERGETPDLSPEQIDALPAMAARLRETAEANLKAARLWQQVHAAMPQWRDGKTPLATALRRYWPR
jgi:hypothetical protein